ncbi:MAG: hypothetical protein J1E80_07825 [Desulfovibrionaceae bacterium]|nr:hypothetical protein [Desulfovibrionaceae bacterium]
MSNNTTRTLSYFFARTNTSYTNTLQQDLLDAAQALPTVEERTFSLAGKRWSGLLLKDRGSSVVFQFSVSVPEEEASTIPTTQGNQSMVSLDTLAAPDGYDFSDGDVICLVKENDVFACPSGIRADSIIYFLRELFKLMDRDPNDDAWALELVRPADKDRLKTILKHGVRKIQFDAFASEPLIQDIMDKSAGRPYNLLFRLLRRDASLLEAAARANAKFSLTISHERGAPATNDKWMMEEADNALDSSPNYKIFTKNNAVITPDQIIITKKISLKSHGKSVFFNEAIKKLEEFSQDVRKN